MVKLDKRSVITEAVFMGDMRRAELAALIINLRTMAGHNREVLAGIQDGSVTLLSRDKAIRTECYQDLPDYEKAFVRAYAVGLGAHRAVLTGYSAARIHGMWVAGSAREPVELALAEIPPRAQWQSGTLYRRLALAEEEILHVGGVRTPRLFRVFVEIARHHGFIAGLVAADWLRGMGMDLEEMRRQVALLGPVRGVRNVRDAVEFSVACSESPFEPYARGLLIVAGLNVQAQALLCDGKYRADLLVASWTVVEIDGDVKYSGEYGETGQVLLEEKKRENRIRNEGMSVLRYSPAELLRDPAKFVREVQAEVERNRAKGAVA